MRRQAAVQIDYLAVRLSHDLSSPGEPLPRSPRPASVSVWLLKWRPVRPVEPPQRPERAASTPAFQPGARPPAGGFIESTSSPVRAINHEIIEFEFHISPVLSSSRPQTSMGISGTNFRSRRASRRSRLKRRGLSTAAQRSGIAPSCHRRSSSEICEGGRPSGRRRGLRRLRPARVHGHQPPASSR